MLRKASLLALYATAILWSAPATAHGYVTLAGADADAVARYDQWQRESMVPMPYATVAIEQRN